jgi:type II secretory pathway component PulF
VVPQYRGFFVEMKAQVPAITQGLFWVSDHIGRLWAVLGCLAAGLVVLRAALRASAAGGRWWERGVMSIPALGRVYHRTHLARLADAMAILVGAGCDLPGALRLAGAAGGSPNLLADCERLAAIVESGHFPDPEEAGARYLPAMMIYSIRLGSQRNDLEEGLYSLSEMYARQARHLQGNLQALLLPILIVLLGGTIACAIAALFMPLVSLIQVLGRM